MVFDAQFLPSIINTIATSIQNDDDLPRFDYGYWLENANSFKMKGLNWQNNTKLPMIFMPVNYNIDVNNEINFYGDANFTLYILGKANLNKSSSSRGSSVFQSVLYPIYDDLMNAMIASNSFDKQGKRLIDHNHRDFYYYDAEINEHKLDYPVDAIILTFSDLKLTYISTCETG